MQLFRSKKILRLESQVKALELYVQQNIITSGTQFINNSIVRLPEWNAYDLTKQYITSDHVYSVVNKIAETASLIPLYPYLVKEEKAKRKLKTLTNRQFYTTKGLFDIQVMQTKALEDAPETDRLFKLLEQPNPYQTGSDFQLAAYCYYLLHGECFVYKESTEEGPNAGIPARLWIFPPDTVALRVTKEFPNIVTGYDFIVDGQTLLANIPPEKMIHWKRFNPSKLTINGAELRGMSPLKSAAYLLERLKESDLRALAQLKNGGVPAIVYDETIENAEVSQDNLDAARKHFFDFITSSDNTGAPYFSAGKKGILQTGLSLADLKLIELQAVDFKRLCNIYKVSTILFNSDVAATESNVNEMVKQMLTNACLPMAYSYRDKLNNELVPDFKDKERFINVDISDITELQEDMKEMAEILATLPVPPTGNEMREMYKFDRSLNPNMDREIIKQGYIFLDDLSAGEIGPDLLEPQGI